MQSPVQRLISAIVLALFCGGFGAFLLVLGISEVRRAHRLSQSTSTLDARAFDWSTVSGDGATDYQLHYEFVIGGTQYSATDATGREGLWQEVPMDVWEASQRTGTLRVRYVPDDPWINEPAIGDPSAMGDHLAGVVLGAACCLSALVLPLFALFGRRR